MSKMGCQGRGALLPLFIGILLAVFAAVTVIQSMMAELELGISACVCLFAPAIVYTVLFLIAAGNIISKECAAVISVMLIPVVLAWLFLTAIFVFPIGL